MVQWHDTDRLRFTLLRDPAATSRGPNVRSGIHPDYVVTQVTCNCGNQFTTRSTKKSGVITVEICSACHPFYTGKQKILDSGGRVARFEARYGKRAGKKK
ncbi:LSU ribosomal protein L31P [Pseudonocardia thermophila]|uniref:Large ribosomal subunit protein bL31 n=1 Tax=Pseudonocardia thermophila TaxID=1848 RepID=A0A1M6QD47_PSETH|nr:LSU ribosomal protein L31P [Pseudonocardia thermophila]